MQDLKFPLPQEGQPASAVVDGIVGGPNADGHPSAEDVRHWEEGWYVWMSKSRWAAQERLDLMLSDLEHQTWWMRVKEQEERAWFENERQRLREGIRAENEEAVWHDGDDAPMPPAMVHDEFGHNPHAAERHPFQNAT